MRLIDGDQLEQRLLDEAARIMAEDLYGKDRQRMARGLQKAAEICRAAEVIDNAPTIDPVKHGRWLIEPYVGKHATLKVLRCSECDNPVTELPDGKDYNYCPNDEVEELKSENKKLEGALWKFKDAIERKTEKLDNYKRLYEESLKDRESMERELARLARLVEVGKK